MNWDQLQNQWKDYAGSARAHWSKLTEADWSAIAGKRDQLVMHVQNRYSVSVEDAEKQVDDWFAALQDIGTPVTRH